MSCNFLQPRAPDLRGSDTLSEISESGTTNSGWTSGWDSREDLRDFVTKIGLKDVSDLYQDRFRVNRKKLEQMLTGDSEAPLPADVFFEQIMDDTSTFISWPSKLKVGAKSKKDPHVRIAGRPEDVVVAKERIMTVLDTRSNRVTMKMDVSYTDHSHIIGKGGLSIKRVMEETKCHVHFPDSNRSNPTEKSNQVSIAGDIHGVELARSRVRQKTPVVFGFELPIMSQHVDPTSPEILKISEKYGVQVMLRTQPKLHATLVLVKGVEWEVDQVKMATELLIEHLCKTIANQIPIKMSMEISPHHHPMVIGKNHGNLKEIMRATGAQIMFPDAQDPNIPSLKKSNITITGNMHNVFLARQLLIGSLPLLLMFDLPESSSGLPTKPEQIAQIQSKFDVAISIRLKAKQNTMACIIKGFERCASNIYKARNVILAIDEPAISADIPLNYMMSTGPSTPQELPTPTPLNPHPLSPMLAPILSPSWHYPSTSLNQAQPSPFILSHPPQFVYNTSGAHNSMSSSGVSSGQFSSSSFEPSRDNSTYSPISSTNSSIMSSPISSPRNSPYMQRHFQETNIEKREISSVLAEIGAGYHGPTLDNRLDRNKVSNFANADYEQKRIAGFSVMQSRSTGSGLRYPNNTWAGYGISHTTPNPAGFKTDSISHNDDDVWKSPYKETFASAAMNSSNSLDQTPTNVLARITSTNWPDLSSLLTSLNLEKYIGLLASHEIDLTTFSSITDRDLLDIGITAFGARRKMLLAISELNKRSNPFSAAPGAERRSSSSSNASPREKW